MSSTQHPNSRKNLIDFSQRDPDNFKEIQRKGSVAGALAKKRKKDLRLGLLMAAEIIEKHQISKIEDIISTMDPKQREEAKLELELLKQCGIFATEFMKVMMDANTTPTNKLYALNSASDYAFGKAVQRTQLIGKDGESVIQPILINNIPKSSDIDKLIKSKKEEKLKLTNATEPSIGGGRESSSGEDRDGN